MIRTFLIGTAMGATLLAAACGDPVGSAPADTSALSGPRIDSITPSCATILEPSHPIEWKTPRKVLRIDAFGAGFTPTTELLWKGERVFAWYKTPEHIYGLIYGPFTPGLDTIGAVADGRVSAAGKPLYFYGPDSTRVTGMTPGRLRIGAASETVVLTGSGFEPADRLLAWRSVAGAVPLETTFISATELHAVIPGSMLGTTDPLEVWLNEPMPQSGTGCWSTTRTVGTLQMGDPLASISRVSPDTVRVGDTVTMTVRGSGFLPGAIVRFNKNAKPTEFVSDSELVARFVVPRYTGGLRWVDVINPAPGASSSHLLVMTLEQVPELFALYPDSIVAGDAVSLTATASAVDTHVMLWNGTPVGSSVGEDGRRITGHRLFLGSEPAGTAAISARGVHSGEVSNTLSLAIRPAPLAPRAPAGTAVTIVPQRAYRLAVSRSGNVYRIQESCGVHRIGLALSSTGHVEADLNVSGLLLGENTAMAIDAARAHIYAVGRLNSDGRSCGSYPPSPATPGVVRMVPNGFPISRTLPSVPRDVVFDGQRAAVYASTDSGVVFALDAQSLGERARVAIGSRGRSLAIDSTNAVLYANDPATGEISALDLTTFAVGRRYQLPSPPASATGALSGELTLPVGSSTLFVIVPGRGVEALDLATGASSRLEAAGTDVRVMAATPDGAELWVADPSSHVIRVISVATRALLRTISIGTSIRQITFDGQRGVGVIAAGSVTALVR